MAIKMINEYWTPFSVGQGWEGVPSYRANQSDLLRELRCATLYYKEAAEVMQRKCGLDTVTYSTHDEEDQSGASSSSDDSSCETLSQCSSVDTLTEADLRALPVKAMAPAPSPPTKAAVSPAKEDSLYKTEMCATFVKVGACPYGAKCRFAHGALELKPVDRHPKFRSTICRNFARTGTCNYGSRCCFLHGKE